MRVARSSVSEVSLVLFIVLVLLGFGIIIYSMVDDLMPNRITKK